MKFLLNIKLGNGKNITHTHVFYIAPEKKKYCNYAKRRF